MDVRLIVQIIIFVQMIRMEERSVFQFSRPVLNSLYHNKIRYYLLFRRYVVDLTSKYYSTDSDLVPYLDKSSTISCWVVNSEGVMSLSLRASTSAPCSSNNRTA